MQGFLGKSGKVRQTFAMCLFLQQWKQRPFLVHCFHSYGVSFFERTAASTSIALGSLVIQGEEKDWKFWVVLLLC